MYRIDFSRDAIAHLEALRKSMYPTYKKFAKLIEELKEHPYTGTGRPEQLRGYDNLWSRRLDKKNRLIYSVEESIVTVHVISALGHYDDK